MDVTYRDLENFKKECENVSDMITPYLNGFNVFNVLGIQYREIRHSNFIGWLLNPNGSHGFGSSILKELLGHLNKMGLIIDSYHSDFSHQAWAKTEVIRECEEDIDLFFINEELGFTIVIENKIYSDFSKHQLDKYYKHVITHYGHIKSKIFLTLTPLENNRHKDKEIVSGKEYTNITYKDILRFLKSNEEIINNSTPSIKESIQQYISMVEKNLTKTSKEIARAKEIYKEYGHVINFIINNQQDFSIYKELIERYFEESKVYEFTPKTSRRNVIFLLPTEVKDLFKYPAAKSRGGEHIFSYVLHIDKDRVWLKLGFGDIVESEQQESIKKVRTEYHTQMKNFDSLKEIKNETFVRYNDDLKDEFVRECSVTLFNYDDLLLISKAEAIEKFKGKNGDDLETTEDLYFMELFKSKFEEINNILLKPFAEECCKKLKKIEV
ncbi:MAG: PD-(D/E)XK nuclease family protein [Muricauda sp.]|nr:PD-(D/E)XK nuclease family protein [Allomuricauda sp.]MBA4745250.1 PD-(D/E)XK nuclease family protein [Allomuricauda sp.]